jgi:hypothetical protein
MSRSSQAPIFIVGAPRTGTTLTHSILSRHPRVHIYNEIHFCERILETMGGEEAVARRLTEAVERMLVHAHEWAPGRDDAAGGCRLLEEEARRLGGTAPALLEAFLSLDARAHGKTIWGDSSPQDILYLGQLKAWFPGARFVCLVRDPRAFLASYKSYSRKGHPGYRDRYSPLPVAMLWRSYMTAQQEALGEPWAADLHTLHYERLVTDPEGEVARLCAFLGLDFTPDLLDVDSRNSSYVHYSQNRQRGISRESLDRWREVLSPTEIWLVEKVCGAQMTRLGHAISGARLDRGSTPELLRIGAAMPGRVYNLLFRTRKPFTWSKLRRVLGNLWG